MIVGAVITAAGLSSRMGDFKPLLKIGGIPAAERVIQTFRAAGIKDIAIVTGNNAGELEDRLRHLDVIYLRNGHYKCTQMFDSIKIGLEYFKDTCDRIFITPVDIPLFTADTVKILLSHDAPVCVPAFNKKAGHPISLDKKIIGGILRYTGGGLKDAITNLHLEKKYVDVADSGILHDMNTPEDYSRIIKMDEMKTHTGVTEIF